MTSIPSERLSGLHAAQRSTRPRPISTQEYWIVISDAEITGYRSQAACIEAIEAEHVVDVTAVYCFSIGEDLPARDVSEDIARAIFKKQLTEDGCLARHTRNFLDEQIGRESWERVA